MHLRQENYIQKNIYLAKIGLKKLYRFICVARHNNLEQWQNVYKVGLFKKKRHGIKTREIPANHKLTKLLYFICLENGNGKRGQKSDWLKPINGNGYTFHENVV